MSIAATPKPPYYAAIFSSVRAVHDDDAAYEAMGERMAMLASQQPGFIGFEGAADTPERFGLFISYWKSDRDIRNWKKLAEHLEAQRSGHGKWYADYKIRIAKVERDYSHKDGGPG